MSSYLIETTDEWIENMKLGQLWEQGIEPTLKVFAPKILEEIEKLSDSENENLSRYIGIMLRQWFEENTEG